MNSKIGVARFMDMHSGGRAKIQKNGIDQNYVYIQAPEKLAVIIFKEMYDRDPENVTCQCCGEDYSVSYADSLSTVTGYERGCDWDYETKAYTEKPRFSDYTELEDYLKKDSVTFVPWSEAKKFLGIPEEE